MPLAFTHLTTAVDDANVAGYTTASISPAANSLLVLGTVGAASTAPGTPTIAGFSATWTAIQSSAFDAAGTMRTLFTFYAQMGASPGSGTITITFPASMSGAGWSVVQVTGHNTTTPTRGPVANNGSSTSQSATLGALADSANNAAIAFVASDEAVTFTAGNTFAMLGQATGAAPVQAVGSLWKLGATNPATTSTGTTSQLWGMVAVEIQMATVVSFPTLTVSLGLGSNPLSASPSWTTIPAGLVKEVHFTSSGRSLELENFEGGSGSIVLDNNDGRFTPGNTASPYYPNIKLRMPIRIVATRGSDTLTIRGYVDATPVSFPNPPNQSVCEWPLIDAFTLLNEKDAEYPWRTVIRQQVPKLWYSFDELSGTTVVDNSGNGHHGTYIASPTLQVAFGTGKGATFNGTTQYVSVPPTAGITGTGDFAVECLIDTTNVATTLYSQWDSVTGVTGVLIGIDGTGIVNFHTNDLTGGTTVNGVINFGSGAEKHLICRRQGTTHQILVNGAIDATVVGTVRNIAAPTSIRLMAHGTPEPPFSFLSGTIDEFVTYQNTFTSARATVHYDALNGWTAINSGTQIGYILDAYGWPSADRSIDAGNSVVLGQFAPTGSVLEMVRLAANSDFGAVYVTLGGTIRFRERQAIMKAPYTTSQGTFGNGSGAIPVVIEDLELSYDASRIKNDVTLKVDWQTGAIVTTPYEVQVRKTDVPSVDSYGAQTWTREVITLAGAEPGTTAMLLGDLADYMLARYKEPLREVRQLVLHPVEESATSLWTHVLTRTQEDRITHTHAAPGGEIISGDYHIQRIRHDIGPGKRWRTTWTISPADTQAYWVWDTSKWDEGTRWAV